MFLQGECRNGLLGSLLSCALALLAAHHNPALSDIMAGHAVMSDMSFGISHERTLDAHAGVGYAYRFDYESPIKVWSDG